MTLYDWLSRAASMQDPHSPLYISCDLADKTILYKDEPIMKQGILIAQKLPIGDELVEIGQLIDFSGDPYAEIERLFEQFYRSVPSRRDHINKGCFKALSSDALTMRELENNMQRQQARLLLEGFVLLMAASGLLPWRNPNQFFWKGSHPCLILYREWITM